MLPVELEVNREPTRPGCYTLRFSTSVAIALSAFLREAFLFMEYLGLELFPSLFQIGVVLVVRKEDVPFDLFQWDFVFSIKILKDTATLLETAKRRHIYV